MLPRTLSISLALALCGCANVLLSGCAPGVTLTREAKITEALQGVTKLQTDIAVENVAALRSLDVLEVKGALSEAEVAKHFKALFCATRYTATNRLTDIIADRSKRLDKFAKAPDPGFANAAAAIRKELDAYKKLNEADPKSFDVPGGVDERLRAAKCESMVEHDLAISQAPAGESSRRFGGPTAAIGFLGALLDAANTLAGWLEKRQRAEVVMTAAKTFKPDVMSAIKTLGQCMDKSGKPVNCSPLPADALRDTDGDPLTVFEYPVARHRLLAMHRARAALLRSASMPDSPGAATASYEKHLVAAYVAKAVAEWNALFDIEFGVNEEHKAMERSLKMLVAKMNDTMDKAFDALATGAPPANADEALAALTETISDLTALSDKRGAYWKAWRGRLD